MRRCPLPPSVAATPKSLTTPARPRSAYQPPLRTHARDHPARNLSRVRHARADNSDRVGGHAALPGIRRDANDRPDIACRIRSGCKWPPRPNRPPPAYPSAGGASRDELAHACPPQAAGGRRHSRVPAVFTGGFGICSRGGSRSGRAAGRGRGGNPHGSCEELREYWHLDENQAIPAPTAGGSSI